MKRDIVLSAVAHNQTEYIPYNIELTKETARLYQEATGIAPEQFDSHAGNHILKCGFDRGETIAPGLFKDEFGVVWERPANEDIGMMQSLLLSEPYLGEFELPFVDEKYIKQQCEAAMKFAGDRFTFVRLPSTMFERAWSLRGFDNMLMDLITEPEFSTKLLTMITDRCIEILKIALEYPFDGVYLADDFGTQKGLLISPNTWENMFRPQYKRLLDFVKSKGRITCLHSCGNIYTILGQLIDIGLDIYQTVQPEIYDLEKLKKNFGMDLTFYGAISTQRVLPFGTTQELRDTVRRTLDILGKNGGFIAAPTHKIPPDTKPENISVLIEELKNQH